MKTSSKLTQLQSLSGASNLKTVKSLVARDQVVPWSSAAQLQGTPEVLSMISFVGGSPGLSYSPCQRLSHLPLPGRHRGCKKPESGFTHEHDSQLLIPTLLLSFHPSPSTRFSPMLVGVWTAHLQGDRSCQFPKSQSWVQTENGIQLQVYPQRLSHSLWRDENSCW